MYLERVPNRNSPPAVPVRSSHWDPDSRKVRKVTLANLSKLPADLVDSVGALRKGAVVVRSGSSDLQIVESRPWGGAAVVLGAARSLGLPGLLHSRRSRRRDLAVALVTLRVLDPNSPATARSLGSQGPMACLNEALGLGEVSEEQLFETLDWLAARQAGIESKLAEECVVRTDRHWSADKELPPADGNRSDHVRARALIDLLSHSVEEHMRGLLAPLLKGGQDRNAWEFRDVLSEMGTLQRHRVTLQPPGQPALPEFRMLTEPSDLHREVFSLLDLPLRADPPGAKAAAGTD